MTTKSDWLHSEISIEKEFDSVSRNFGLADFVKTLELPHRFNVLMAIHACALSKHSNQLTKESLYLAEEYHDLKANRHEMKRCDADLSALIHAASLGENFYYYRYCQLICNQGLNDNYVAPTIFNAYRDYPIIIPTIGKIISSFVSPTLQILPEHKTSTVRVLANGIYWDKAWDRMPILADALQDAGYNQELHLERLRDTKFPWRRGAKILELLKTS